MRVNMLNDQCGLMTNRSTTSNEQLTYDFNQPSEPTYGFYTDCCLLFVASE
jgi:hypothetical protein